MQGSTDFDFRTASPPPPPHPDIALLAITLCEPLSTPKHIRSDERVSHFCVLTQCEDVSWIQLAPTKFLFRNQNIFGLSNDGGWDEQGMWHAWGGTEMPSLGFMVKLEGKKQLRRFGRRW